METRLPNFLFLGVDKAGSSWLHEALLRHPQVYLTPAKDLYFFDRYYDRGLEWYAGQFRGAAASHAVVGEICPDYLASPHAPERIRSSLGDVRLMATLRDPVSRAYSSFLYMRKHGEGPPTFRAALRSFPDLIEHGRYGTQLRRYRSTFDPRLLHVALFDDLQSDPQGFFDGVLSFLGLERCVLDERVLEARLPASRARFVPAAYAARRAADFVRSRDGAAMVGRVKRSLVVQRMLYRPLGDQAPPMEEGDADYVREALTGEVLMVEEEIGLPLRERWGW